MAGSTDHDDATHLEQNHDVIRIVLPGYRKCYAPNDFTDSRTRSQDNAIAAYLSKSAVRPWWNAPLKLVLKIAGEARDSEQEGATIRAYREMFGWRARAAVRRFMHELPLVFTLVTIGVAFLWISNRVDETTIEKDARNTLSDVVQVGAWVALWSAISLLFSTGFESLAKYIAFRRLTRIPVEFEYGGKSPSPNRPKPARSLKLS
jgi:hypothetical protein